MSHDASVEQQILATIDKWVEQELRPIAREFDQADEYPGDLVEQMKDNFRNLLLTSPGERLGRHDFGAGLRNLSIELVSLNDDYESVIMAQIKEAVDKYMPYINLRTMSSDHFIIDTRTDNKQLAKIVIIVEYDIPSISVTDQKIDLLLYIGG